MTPCRHSDAGVSLVEMLVVLALLATLAGGVALSLPSARTATASEAAAHALAAHLERGVDHALTTGAGFGVTHDGTTLRFVQQGDGARWVPHSDPHLAQVKLSAPTSRISINAQEVFAVSAHLIPNTSTPLRVTFGNGTRGQVVVFDGAQVHRSEGQ